uniref:Uncharacterized protein n=1 Tax=Panagrolaimus sp. PS1159 TaxID=55785 RepID=A0AC35GF21_9BILA
KGKNDKSLNIASKSTLSLHISAYKNGIEDTDELKVLSANTKEKFEKNNLIQNDTKSFDPLSQFYGAFEFPRQMKDKISMPGIMKFKASQKLAKPNTKTVSLDKV